ncbi:LrgB family protein [Nocardioides sp. AE5]|uniref:LrgB family protein n=1 Tax=Nocardioides sp. AE5 TaxID=2962573 RepID=UPI002882BE00|nr:LrgB family protein [Nocardioides sp. AE5]MDT0200733.1 LrgB family protein [Nocardioides sp. AE5]
MSEVLDYLRTSPLTGVFLTLLGYRIGRELKRLSGDHPLVQPVLVAILLIGPALWLLDIDYEQYLIGGSVIAFFLGPATVALAVPLHRQAHHLKELVVPMLVAIPLGAFVSISAGVLLVRALGGDRDLELTMAPKSATTPIAIAITEQVGGVAALVAVFTIVAGIIGAVAGPSILNLLRIRDRRARGLAIGAVSHGIGTSRALAEHPVEGAFSGLSMGLSALATSLLVPLVIHLLG